MKVQPLVQSRSRTKAQIAVVKNAPEGAARTADGFEFVAPLAPPLGSYGVRAVVPNAAGTQGWENARRISTLVCLIAVFLTALGAYLALRGMRKEAETMKLRGALIANVSHELRTPLSMIRLGAETLKRGSRLGEKQRAEIEDSILREVLHLSHMVENVLDVARMQNRSTKVMAFTPVYPRDLVTSLISTYESWIRSKGFEVNLRIDDPVAEQLWDREAVARAVLNLIDNAIKYSSDSKVLEVVLRQTEENVLVEVKDTGIGISPDNMTKIFDPFFTTKDVGRGTGLGLAVCYGILSDHGGRLDVRSNVAVGTTFTITLPVATD